MCATIRTLPPYSFPLELLVKTIDCGAAVISDLNQVPNRSTSQMWTMADVDTATFKFRIKTKLV
jgi:hypothetical protein